MLKLNLLFVVSKPYRDKSNMPTEGTTSQPTEGTASSRNNNEDLNAPIAMNQGATYSDT